MSSAGGGGPDALVGGGGGWLFALAEALVFYYAQTDMLPWFINSTACAFAHWDVFLHHRWRWFRLACF